jgi:cell division protein FtsI/penicillin-binding protein 2
MQDLWRKVAELEAEPRRAQGMRRPRSGARIGRAVAAIAVPLLGAHHTISHRAATTPSHGQLTLNPAAQRVAARRLGGRAGAVVAVDPRTGAIRVMYGNSTRGDRDPAAAAGAAAALGTPADLKGVQIAGKTATTAAGSRSGHHDLWFVGFAPADHPKIAIAVLLKGAKGGFGGTEAAPIASAVIQKLLAGPQP